MATLFIDTGAGSQLDFEIGPQGASIGASGDNDIVLRVPGVAPHHLVIRPSGERFTFLAQQRQVVLVNGKRRARGVLGDGDRIRVGTATLSLRLPETAGDTDLPDVDTEAAGEAPEAAEVDSGSGRPRAEMVVFKESPRRAEVRRHLLEIFREVGAADVSEKLENLLLTTFEGRRALLGVMDPRGQLQPIITAGRGGVPHVPEQIFVELDKGNRVIVLRTGERQLVIDPLPEQSPDHKIYLVAETSAERAEEDREVVSEMVSMLAARWQEVADSSALLGRWEQEARARVESRVPGTSTVVRALRDEVIAAARSARPVLLYGPAGSGRAFLGSLIASLRPSSSPWIRMVQVRERDDSRVAAELFGSATTVGARDLAEHAGGGVVVVRDIQRMPSSLQHQLATAIASDMGSGYGSRVRWILTADSGSVEGSPEPAIATALLDLSKHHLIRVPPLEERPEDLPLLIVRLLDVVASEQGKEVAGIDLDTLDSLLTHGFNGQMTELIAELRRLVSATPRGETIRGAARGEAPAGGGEAPPPEVESETVEMLQEDDLKLVIPAVERMLIDRVLRRARGNQSKAARELNLSRGALISKIKEYDIPDYRALRRRGG